MKEHNRLIHEKSPYLLQHAANPVDWYPWSDEAFERALREDKPVFLSVGYSTCHWCHVMERESFENADVATLMNDVFISIKVDREERPDIDAFYMNVCQAMTGSGGWPLTVLMTPDRKPFFAGTYFPKESRYGRMGLLELVPKVKELWIDERQKVLDSAHNITSAVIGNTGPVEKGAELTGSILHEAFRQLEMMFDERSGGFGSRPRFPMAHYIMLLLRIWKNSKNERALEMVEKTLSAMAKGGIFDHLGGGFHRYSTDSEWILPHFEKMLYDQAMLSLAYTEAFLATGKRIYRETAEKVIEYVLREMTSPEGGFFSAEDADSEGVEGKFYLWTVDELRSLLSEEETEVVMGMYNVADEGNFRDEATGERNGGNILYITESPDDRARSSGASGKVFHDLLCSARKKLFTHRSARVRPHLDDKVLADWNGLMIAACSKAAQAFGDERYHEAARRAADFVLERMKTPSDGLFHRYREGESGIEGYLDDYAFLIWGLLELYETGFDPSYLLESIRLTENVLEHFSDEKEGGFYLVREDVDDVPVRAKIKYDGAVPSGNSVMMYNLLRLSHITGEEKYYEEALKAEQGISGEIRRSPTGYAMSLVALDYRLSKIYEIIVAGFPGNDDTRALLSAVREGFLPYRVVLFLSEEAPFSAIRDVSDFLKSFPADTGSARAYICRDRTCGEPVEDRAKILRMLGF